MDLKGFFFNFRHTDCYKKTLFFLGIFLYSINSGYGQGCVPAAGTSIIETSDVNPSTCDGQSLIYPNVVPPVHPDPVGSIIKINLGNLTTGNTYRFSTVGETQDDTELTLYDKDGHVILYNDNDDAYSTLQSTIVLRKVMATYETPYLIISAKGCKPLTKKPLGLKFSAENDYDKGPDISEITSFYPCEGERTTLISTLSPKAATATTPAIPGGPTTVGNTWGSSNLDVATINPRTGEVYFKQEGTVEISLQNPDSLHSACVTLKRYVIRKAMTTSAIIHD